MRFTEQKDIEHHQIKEALRTLRLAYEDIKAGYRFDDQFATSKIETLGHAVTVIETCSGRWLKTATSDS